MAKKALIKITGKQIYGPDHDDSIELTTIGTLEETDDTYIIRYKEIWHGIRRFAHGRLRQKY